MRIISLSLVGNTRLLPSGTREIHFTPKSDVQLIIGNNGSGKSTILGELSPLPANRNDYDSGGYKEIVVQHGDYYYQLKSVFSKGQKHYFNRAVSIDELSDESNLNTGHTLTIQKQLVAEHLNYTSEIHDLLLGKVKFTELTAQKRKEWFVKLCSVDVTYAVEVYQRLQTAARNTVGARKHTELKLLDERSKLLSEDDIKDLQKNIDDISKLVRAYSEAKSSIASKDLHRLPDIDREIEVHISEISRLSESIIRKSHMDLRGISSAEDLRQQMDAVLLENSRSDERIKSIKREYESIEELVNMVSGDNTVSLESIRNERNEIAAKLELLTVDAELFNRTDLQAMFTSATSIVDELDELLLQLPINPSYEKFNKSKLAEAERALEDINAEISRVKYSIDTKSRRLDELSRHEPTQCPNCNHVWIPGVSEDEVARLTSQIESANGSLPELDARRASINEYLQDYDEWKELFLRYSAYAREYPSLTVLWDSFMVDKRILNQPKSLIGETRRLIARLSMSIGMQKLIERRDFLDTAIVRREQIEGDKGSVLTARAKYLEDQLATEQIRLKDNQLLYAKLGGVFRTIEEIAKMKTELTERMDKFSSAMILKDQQFRNGALDSEINQLMLNMAGSSKMLNEALGKTQVVEHLETTLKELTLAEADYQLLIQAISPTEGLIADSLMGFINSFVEQMNYIIGKIWTINMRILPCKTDSSDLDYKFPLKFDYGNPRDDVSMGSMGQKELVDYVFVLMAMKHMGIKDCPLLMDEVGHFFHDTHRIKLFDYVKQLLEMRMVGQIFAVSHFSNTHGSLTHADVNVIDNTGVLVPANANRCMVIK